MSAHFNPITGKNLADICDDASLAALDTAMLQNRYAHPEWAAFKQWQKASPPRSIKRGQKGTKLYTKSGANYWYVFNIDQTQPRPDKAERQADRANIDGATPGASSVLADEA